VKERLAALDELKDDVEFDGRLYRAVLKFYCGM
jgi:hypothetical protein